MRLLVAAAIVLVVAAGAVVVVRSLTRLVPLEDVVQVAAAGERTCALRSDGSVVCWGRVGDTYSSPPRAIKGRIVTRHQRYPRAVEGVTDAVELVTDGSRTCALMRTGRARCWGHSAHEAPGPEVSMADLLRSEDIGVDGVTAIGLGAQACVAADGRVTCSTEWDPRVLDVPVVLPAGRTAARVAVSAERGCAVLDDGAMACWPLEVEHPLGPSTEPGPVTATIVASLAGVDDVVLSSPGGCVLHTDGEVSCWVDRAGGTGEAFVVATDGRVVELARDGERTCALRADGRVLCWEVFADAPEDRVVEVAPRPEPVAGIDDATGLAVGHGHVCVVDGAGQVRCWGHNGAGQTGWGTGYPDTPTKVDDPVTVLRSGHRRSF